MFLVLLVSPEEEFKTRKQVQILSLGSKSRAMESETEKKEDIIKPVVAEGSWSLNLVGKFWKPAYNTHFRVISLEGLGNGAI